jgi:hypothetical protein
VRVDAQGRWQSLPVALVGSSTDRGGSLPAPARRRSLKLKDHLIRTGLWLVVAATVAGWVLGFASQTGRRRVGRVLTGLSALAFSAGALRLSVFGGNASWLGRAVVLAAVVVVACLAFASWLVLLAQFALPALSAWTLRRARERNRRANP